MQNTTTDGIGMQGTLCVTVKDAFTGVIKRQIKIRNKITFLMADVLVELIAQRAADSSPALNSLYSMRMGSSNTPAARSDTNLGAFVIGQQLTDVSKVTAAPGEIQFLATLAPSDAVGSTLREAGLFTAGSSPSVSSPPTGTSGGTRMLARQVFPDVPKTSGLTVDFSWTIAFTATP